MRLRGDVGDPSPEEIRRTLHELRVYQIELEMQNEELRRAQAELDVARARYFDLYEFAPAGYCTLSEEGLIVEANLNAAALLGVARAALLRRPVTGFILAEDRSIYSRSRAALAATGELQACEVRVLRADGTTCWVHLAISAPPHEGDTPRFHVALSDVDELGRKNRALLESRNEPHRLSSQLLTAHEAERGRVASELRDGICQTLVGLGLTLDAALRLDMPAADRDAILGLLGPRIRDAVGEVRAIFNALRPAMLDELGLMATVSWFSREFQASERGIRVTSHVDVEEHDVPRALRTPIFRVLQETMNNIAAHGGADEVVLSFRKNAGRLELSLEDNGRGFDSSASRAEDGIGFGRMRQWTELSGGCVQVAPRPGGGTEVRASWPLGGDERRKRSKAEARHSVRRVVGGRHAARQTQTS